MENYAITISKDKEEHHFEVGEYMRHDDEKCKFRVFMNGVYVASFTPDDHNFLHICQNPGNVDEGILHLLADEIESHHPHGMNKMDNIRKLKL
jgi:hypothetical protein